MYCIGCGKKIQDGAKFCINCGREIGKSENSIKTEKNLSDVQTEENGNSTKKGCKFLLIPAKNSISLQILKYHVQEKGLIYGYFLKQKLPQ